MLIKSFRIFDRPFTRKNEDLFISMKTVVGVSDFRVSSNVNEVIVTYALGSCLGITIFDPVTTVGGLLHVMLPHSKADPEKAKREPTMYVDTGLTLVLDKLYAIGARKENLEISVAGGASMRALDRDDYFKIGKRNFTVFRKYLWKNGLMITNKDIGGEKARTMTFKLKNGEVMINKKPMANK